jgi:hypothetical protein
MASGSMRARAWVRLVRRRALETCSGSCRAAASAVLRGAVLRAAAVVAETPGYQGHEAWACARRSYKVKRRGGQGISARRWRLPVRAASTAYAPDRLSARFRGKISVIDVKCRDDRQGTVRIQRQLGDYRVLLTCRGCSAQDPTGLEFCASLTQTRG